MVRKLAVLSGAVAALFAVSIASVPAYSVPLTSLKADPSVAAYPSVTLVDRDGGGKWGGGNKNWSGGKQGNNKNWDGNHHGNNKNWDNKGGHNKWSGKGHGGKKWAYRGNWYAGQRHQGYWRDGLWISLPFIVGNACYDYLDWRDGAPRPGWYWVC
jgi:hypothetical protein